MAHTINNHEHAPSRPERDTFDAIFTRIQQQPHHDNNEPISGGGTDEDDEALFTEWQRLKPTLQIPTYISLQVAMETFLLRRLEQKAESSSISTTETAATVTTRESTLPFFPYFSKDRPILIHNKPFFTEEAIAVAIAEIEDPTCILYAKFQKSVEPLQMPMWTVRNLYVVWRAGAPEAERLDADGLHSALVSFLRGKLKKSAMPDGVVDDDDLRTTEDAIRDWKLHQDGANSSNSSPPPTNAFGAFRKAIVKQHSFIFTETKREEHTFRKWIPFTQQAPLTECLEARIDAFVRRLRGIPRDHHQEDRAMVVDPILDDLVPVLWPEYTLAERHLVYALNNTTPLERRKPSNPFNWFSSQLLNRWRAAFPETTMMMLYTIWRLFVVSRTKAHLGWAIPDFRDHQLLQEYCRRVVHRIDGDTTGCC